MLPLLLAAASAVSYGVSDFVGGLRARSAHYVWVTLVSQVVLTVGVLGWAAVRGGTPSASAFAWGALAALGHVTGTLMLMRGFTAGAMHVAGPLSAVCGAALPVAVGVALGERPAPLAWVGIAAALPAVWLVASGDSSNADVAAGPGVPAASGAGHGASEGARDGMLAGLGFAVFFVALARADPGAGAWPLVSLEIVALLALIGVAAWLRPPGSIADGLSAWPQGALSLTGAITYFLAAQSSLLSVVVVITSLYPAFTVLLAMTVLHERPSRWQLAGLACAAASVVLIAVGSH